MPILDDDSNDQMMMIFETNHSPSLLKRNFYYAFDLSLRTARRAFCRGKERREREVMLLCRAARRLFFEVVVVNVNVNVNVNLSKSQAKKLCTKQKRDDLSGEFLKKQNPKLNM